MTLANIDVKKVGGKYHVTLKEGNSSMSYDVGLPEEFYQKLTKGKISKSECIKSAFRFLLDHEPKESILGRFDLPLISQYFPQFEQEFTKYT